MPDLIFIALTIIFFLLALAYVRGCEKLQGVGKP
jgi:succinate-acetate transporter protein